MRKNQEFWVIGNFSLKHRLLLLVLFCLVSVLIFLYVFGDVVFYCPFNKFLNFNCLTCGSTTAFRELINGGGLSSVFAHNPLFYFWVIIFSISYFDFMIFTVFYFKINLLYKLMILIENKLVIRYSIYLVFICNLVYLNFIK